MGSIMEQRPFYNLLILLTKEPYRSIKIKYIKFDVYFKNKSIKYSVLEFLGYKIFSSVESWFRLHDLSLDTERLAVTPAWKTQPVSGE